MLIKQLFQDKDYKKALQRRIRAWSALAALGIVLILLAITVLDQSDLPDFVQGFYLGAGVGLVLAGVFFAIRAATLLSKPEEAKKQQISETDERRKAIIAASMQTVFWTFYYVLTLGLFISLPLSYPVFFTLLGMMVLMSVSFAAAMAWYSKKM